MSFPYRSTIFCKQVRNHANRHFEINILIYILVMSTYGLNNKVYIEETQNQLQVTLAFLYLLFEAVKVL